MSETPRLFCGLRKPECVRPSMLAVSKYDRMALGVASRGPFKLALISARLASRSRLPKRAMRGITLCWNRARTAPGRVQKHPTTDLSHTTRALSHYKLLMLASFRSTFVLLNDESLLLNSKCLLLNDKALLINDMKPTRMRTGARHTHTLRPRWLLIRADTYTRMHTRVPPRGHMGGAGVAVYCI
jgi:hypothetical protein